MIVVYLWEGGEIAVYQHLGFVARDVQTLCKSEDGNTINDTEIGSFGFGSFVTCHFRDILLIDIGCSSRMEVFTLTEHFYHIFILR